MGEFDIATGAQDEAARRTFARALLDDLATLDRMIEMGLIESGVRRLGAEQEMFLVDAEGHPAPIALKVLDRLQDPRYTTEIALFNLECNLAPRLLQGDCLRVLEESLTDAVAKVREAASAERPGSTVLLTGILPTLTLAHLSLDMLTPLPRYHELNRLITELAGSEIRTLINGVDQLQLVHDNVMLEACNTSFQIHMQVGAEEFPRLYNLAQVITAPVLAAAVNAPLLLAHRLWHETRIALFQQSLDIRTESGRLRDTWQRVSFGNDWVHASAAEVLRDQVARHRVLLTRETGEPSSARLARGEIPQLRALTLHNGTIYRWNRVCYGTWDGRPHLRIEHRPLPAGPTVLDEVANAALFYGLMSGLGEKLGDVRREFRFDDVRGNFLAAARSGLGATFRWGRQAIGARELLLDQLLPTAHEGLRRCGVPDEDRERYLGIIEERVRSGRTGAQWQLDGFRTASSSRTRAIRAQELTRAMIEREATGEPVHRWAPPSRETTAGWKELHRTVAQVMTTDLFIARPYDLVDVAASLMEWKHIRHVPVEADDGSLVGLVSYRAMLRHLIRGRVGDPVPVKDLMEPDPITVPPEATCLSAIRLMKRHGVGCLPVVHRGRLVGIVSERDFLALASRLFEEQLAEEQDEDQGCD